jgi:hypothetical protein
VGSIKEVAIKLCPLSGAVEYLGGKDECVTVVEVAKDKRDHLEDRIPSG